jgi:membrane protein
VGARRLGEKRQRIEERLLGIPAVQLVARTARELGADDAPHMAAGVAYYALLSLFPLMLALIAVLGLFLPSATVQEELFEFMERNMPGAVDELEHNIEGVIRLRGPIGVTSLILLFWSASATFGAIARAVNRAWDIHQDRPFHVRKLRDLTMALGTGILFLLSLGSGAVFSILRDMDLLLVSAAAEFGVRFVGFLLSLTIFLLIYKFIPNTKTFWRYVWPGALLSATLFEIAKTFFLLYLTRFANYELVYGSVASIIVLLVWIYSSAFIIILGAEFSAEYGRMRERVSRGVSLADARAKSQKPESDESTSQVSDAK